MFDRGTWEDWEAAGQPTARDRARDRARALLAAHEPAPLPAGIAADLDQVVAEAERAAGLAGQA